MPIAEERKQKELSRLTQLTEYEHPFWQNGVYVSGMDEVGRGPLAGPVVTACVIMPDEPLIEGINDSKKLSEKKRERLYEQILSHAVAYGFGWVWQDTIDRLPSLHLQKHTKT